MSAPFQLRKFLRLQHELGKLINVGEGREACLEASLVLVVPSFRSYFFLQFAEEEFLKHFADDWEDCDGPHLASRRKRSGFFGEANNFSLFHVGREVIYIRPLREGAAEFGDNHGPKTGGLQKFC